MKIQLKMMLITSLVSILILISVSILANNIISGGFMVVENSHMIKDVEIVNNALIGQAQSIDAVTHDYANWDTTYYALTDENTTYGTVDLAGSLQNTRLDFVIILRNDGKIIFARDVFSGEEKGYDVSTADVDTKAFYHYFEKNYASITCTNELNRLSGLIRLPKGTAIISSRPILKSDGTGPVQGTIIFGKMMDKSFVEKISNQTQLSFSLQLYDSITYETKLKLNMLFNDNANNIKNSQNNFISGNSIQDVSEILYGSNNSNIVQVLPIDEDTISGNVLLKDIFGRPVVLLEVNDTRAIYHEGKNSVKYAFQAVLLAMIIFVILEYFLFNKFIIGRILSMESQMRNIQNKKLASSRITITGDDELSSFGESVNSALDIIEKANEEKQAVFDADPDTYFYVDTSWKIIDYKLTDTLEDIISKQNLSKLKTLYLSNIFNSAIINKLSKVRLESVKTRKSAILDFDLSIKGSLRVFEARIVSVNNNNNNNMSLILLRDITERKKFEQQLLEKNMDLEKFNKIVIDRELKMSDLKKEIRDLKSRKDNDKK
jgi:adenylate cyclase